MPRPHRWQIPLLIEFAFEVTSLPVRHPKRLTVNTQKNKIMAYDVLVLGSGPGGYVAAIRAA